MAKRAILICAAFCATAALSVGVAGAQPPTTLDRTITGDLSQNQALPYGFGELHYSKGWKRVVRNDVTKAKAGREKRRKSLLYFGQMTDRHIIDEESPVRLELYQLISPSFSSAWRPQESMVPQIDDQMIRTLNQFAPASIVRDGKRKKAKMELTVDTGDSIDSNESIELNWALQLFNGGKVTPHSGQASTDPCSAGDVAPDAHDHYNGVQDYSDYKFKIDGFWDPNEPYGKYSKWPRYPGLMDQAQKEFDAEGSKVPTYAILGNHDVLVQGNLSAPLEALAKVTGCKKEFAPIPQLPKPAQVASFPKDNFAVPKDQRREYMNRPNYRKQYFDGKQKDAHGFAYVSPAELKDSNGSASYYAWSPKKGFRFIVLDTNANGKGFLADGNIDNPQFAWLKRELAKSKRKNELTMIFSHHPIRSLNVRVADETAGRCMHDGNVSQGDAPGCDLDPRTSTPLHLGDDLEQLLLKNPQVIAHIAGHTHENKITGFPNDKKPGYGFWGVETSSAIDWPLQTRMIQLMDNKDGTLSLFGTMLDFDVPLDTPPSGTDASSFGARTLAAIGRKLAFNNPKFNGKSGIGKSVDENVELIVKDPRPLLKN